VRKILPQADGAYSEDKILIATPRLGKKQLLKVHPWQKSEIRDQRTKQGIVLPHDTLIANF
jgi:hypothetical protein